MARTVAAAALLGLLDRNVDAAAIAALGVAARACDDATEAGAAAYAAAILARLLRDTVGDRKAVTRALAHVDRAELDAAVERQLRQVTVRAVGAADA